MGRKTCLVLLVALRAGRTTEVVPAALGSKILTPPEAIRRSLTWNRVKEMAAQARFTSDTGVPVFSRPRQTLGWRPPAEVCAQNIAVALTAETAVRMHKVVDRWAASHPQVAAWLDTALEDGLACFAFPASHRRRIRSTNGLERFNQELKRRTRVVRIFPNPEACLRLVSAMCLEQSAEWLAGRVYLDMTKLDAAGEGQAPRDSVVTEEVKNMAA